jgi:pyrimidine-nucleoside phosphorylase
MTAEKGGWITSIRAEEIGVAALLLGAGRTKKSDVIDPAVGLWMKKRLGDPVKPGDVLAVLYVNDQSRLEEVRARFSGAVEIGPEAPAKRPLIHRIITRD